MAWAFCVDAGQMPTYYGAMYTGLPVESDEQDVATPPPRSSGRSPLTSSAERSQGMGSGRGKGVGGVGRTEHYDMASEKGSNAASWSASSARDDPEVEERSGSRHGAWEKDI